MTPTLTAYGIFADHGPTMLSHFSPMLVGSTMAQATELVMPNCGITQGYVRAYALSNADMRTRTSDPDMQERTTWADLRWPLPNPHVLSTGAHKLHEYLPPGLHIVQDHARGTRHAILRWMFYQNPATGRGLKRPKLYTLVHALDACDRPQVEMTSDAMAPVAAATLVQFCRARQWFWAALPPALRDDYAAMAATVEMPHAPR